MPGAREQGEDVVSANGHESQQTVGTESNSVAYSVYVSEQATSVREDDTSAVAEETAAIATARQCRRPAHVDTQVSSRSRTQSPSPPGARASRSASPSRFALGSPTTAHYALDKVPAAVAILLVIGRYGSFAVTSVGSDYLHKNVNGIVHYHFNSVSKNELKIATATDAVFDAFSVEADIASAGARYGYYQFHVGDVSFNASASFFTPDVFESSETWGIEHLVVECIKLLDGIEKANVDNIYVYDLTDAPRLQSAVLTCQQLKGYAQINENVDVTLIHPKDPETPLTEKIAKVADAVMIGLGLHSPMRLVRTIRGGYTYSI